MTTGRRPASTTTPTAIPQLDLSKFGAEVGKPDLFVEIDWQAGRKPHLAALYKVKEAFQLAPRPINLHTVTDEQVPGDAPIETSGRGFGRYDDVVDFTVGDGPCDGFFGTREDREAENSRRAAPRASSRSATRSSATPTQTTPKVRPTRATTRSS